MRRITVTGLLMWAAVLSAAPAPRARIEYDPRVDSMVAAVSQPSFISYIQTLEDFTTRNSRTSEYAQAAAWAADTLAAFGLDAHLRRFDATPDPYWGPPFTCWNVVAEQTGLLFPDRIYILCGHLDSTAGQPSGTEPVAPGADDNASGVATVLEAARILAPLRFACTIRYVLFGSEEQSHCGSLNYADSLAAAGADIRGVINYDMVLYDGSGNRRIRVPHNQLSEQLALTFADVCRLYVPNLDVAAVYQPYMIASDHASFWENGYPAILGIEDDFLTNHYVHSVDDLLANYSQYFPFGTLCVQGAVAAIASLAGPLDPASIEAGSPMSPDSPLCLILTGAQPVRHQVRAKVLWQGAAEGAVTDGSVQLVDLSGRVCADRGLRNATAAGDITLTTEQLPSGTYWLRAKVGTQQASRRVLVVR